MTAYTRPGIGLDEQIIIQMITNEFKLPSTVWVTTKSRITNVRVARQLLFTCLIDHLGYGLRRAGAVCNRDHATAHFGRNQILSVYWFDKEYGESVRVVYNRCVEILKIK